jgi:hypothetical protein
MNRSIRRLLLIIATATGAALTQPVGASSLLISVGSGARSPAEVEADYTTSHLFISETANDSVPITVFFNPQAGGAVASAEVFTNLNRRDWATATAGGVEEGIEPPDGNTIAAGDDGHYYKAYAMRPVPGGFQLTLHASKTGVYRLTARYRLASDPPVTYHWYNGEQNAQGILKRDHDLVVSPLKARDLQLYEANPLTITASGTAPEERGTFASMAVAAPSAGGPGFSLSYLKQLGVNALWLQPIHPREIEARPAGSGLGSPYGVKNYFAAMPLMASAFTPGATPESQDTPQGRAAALGEFQAFMRAASAQDVTVFLDAPLDHTAHDAELASAGQGYWGSAGASATSEFRNVEARVYSRLDEYDQRANSANDIAPAPDRYDFGKWLDVSHIYFGRYAALVANQSQQNNYTNEGDWFDYSVGAENAAGQGNGHFDQITQNVWRYFGDYLQYWLTQSGYPDNPQHAALDTHSGIGGLRADFAQGLPPQAWEYLVNRTRARRWDFVFLAESLDGGPVTYRSGRQFDILNDNLIYGLHTATIASDFAALYGARRQAYGEALVLLNTTSQDEDNYKDPYEAALRFAINSAGYGATLIFPGQELGLRGTIVPPNGNPTNNTPFGYDRFQINFGKPIPDFENYNSMMPLWRLLGGNTGDAVHLHAFYAAVSQARRASPALRSENAWFLNLKGNAPENQIFGEAKVDKPGGAASDVVFAFVNLAVGADSATPNGVGFDVNINGSNGNVFGIRPDRTYNVRNIAAISDLRRSDCLWGSGRTGAEVLQNGIFVSLNRVPTDEAGWASAPFEAQYLKLIDMTSNPSECRQAASAKHAVLTRSYDNGRTGANTGERMFTPAAIKARGIKRAFSLNITGDDPRIEAQPLYAPDVKMADGTTRDVIYVFSMSNNVWAFDANDGEPLWPHPVSLGKPFLPDWNDAVDSHHINRSFGVLSTPVIDRETNTIYAVSWIVDAQNNRQLKLNAIHLADGKPPAGKETPLSIQGSVTNAQGQTIELSQVQKQRAALLLTPLGAKPNPQTHRIVYVAFTGDDNPPPRPDATLGHHGWVVAFDVDDWRETAAWLPTPSSFGGGIWQSSQGLAADDEGNVYGVTSNGGFLVNPDQSKVDFNGKTDFAESFFRLSLQGNSLKLEDWFSPFRDSERKFWTMPEVAPFGRGWDYTDQDVGAGGAVLPTGTKVVLGAGKDGVLYVLNRDNLGKSIGDFSKLEAPPAFLTFDASAPPYNGASASGNLDFKPQPGLKTRHLHGSPVYWVSAKHGPMLFAWGENAELRAFSIDLSGRIKLLAHGAELASGQQLATARDNLGGMPGGMIILSADGQNRGIVWGTAPAEGDANMEPVPGVVRAYDVTDFDPAPDASSPAKLRLLWQQEGFTYSKFCPPVVADGKLLVPTYDGRVDVYELQ